MPSLTFHPCFNLTFCFFPHPWGSAPQPFQNADAGGVLLFPAVLHVLLYPPLSGEPMLPESCYLLIASKWASFKAVSFFLQIQNVLGMWISKVATGTSRQLPAP